MNILEIAQWVGISLGALAAVPVGFWVSGFTIISETQVGLVIKKFGKALPEGRIVATNGEAGYQANVLGPGWHFGYFPWQYKVEKTEAVQVPQGQIALIVAEDGSPMPSSRILGKTVECNSFQDPLLFLTNGGQKGKQAAILTTGTYRLNRRLFTVITQEDAQDYGVNPSVLNVLRIEADNVGIVSVQDGVPVQSGEIAGPIVLDHDNFQNVEKFLAAGGCRGLQEQPLLSGSWNINPWFASVERVPMTEIKTGHVGVVTSFVGKPMIDVSGEKFKHGNLVDQGHKGIWAEPLYPGKHAINTKAMRVEMVPTTSLALNWATNRSESHKLDEKLSSIKVRSKDGFSFTLDVTQVVHVGAKEASKVISRFGTMENLVYQVLEPAIGNYFRNSAQNYTALDFLSARAERQKDAFDHISAALNGYDVESKDTYIGDIVPPEALMLTLTDRKIAEEQQKTFAVQEEAQKNKQKLMREQSIAEKQKDIVDAEQTVRITEMKANQAIQTARGTAEALKTQAAAEAESVKLRATGEAESVKVRALGDANALTTRAQAEGDAAKARATGEADALKTKSQAEGDAAQAKATGEASAIKLIAEAEAEKIEKVGKAQGEAYRLASQGMGPENYANIQMIKSIAENKVKLVPDTLIGAGNGGPGMSMLESLFGQTLLTRVNRSNGTNGHLTS